MRTKNHSNNEIFQQKKEFVLNGKMIKIVNILRPMNSSSQEKGEA